jgi:formylmethanofuran dehydrogenase subunit E
MVNSHIGDLKRVRENGIVECQHCGELFLSQAAFDVHRSAGECLTPQNLGQVGLSKTAKGWEVKP